MCTAATHNAGAGGGARDVSLAGRAFSRRAVVVDPSRFCRFLSGLLSDLSSQVVSAADAAAAARGRAELLLNQSRVITPHRCLLHHDMLLLSSPVSVEPAGGSELLSEGVLEEGVRLARDAMSVFPLQVALCLTSLVCGI